MNKRKALIRERMKRRNLTVEDLLNELKCDEKTLRNYLNGKTKSGPYLVPLLMRLEISIEEWNACLDVDNHTEER